MLNDKYHDKYLWLTNSDIWQENVFIFKIRRLMLYPLSYRRIQKNGMILPHW